MVESQDNAALYKAIMLCTPQQSDGSKHCSTQKPFNSTVATSQPLGTSGMKARKTCAKKPSPAQVQHRAYLKNLRNTIKANVERYTNHEIEQEAKRTNAAQNAEKQRKIVQGLKDGAHGTAGLSADVLENALAKRKPIWALTESQLQEAEEEQAEQAEEALVDWATNLDWSKYLNENDEFKRIVSVAKKAADDLFFDDLVAEFNAEVEETADEQQGQPCDASEFSIDTSASATQRRQAEEVCCCSVADDDAASQRELVRKVRQELSRVNPEGANIHSDVSVSAIVNHCKQQLDQVSVDLAAPDPVKVVHGDKERSEEVQVQNLPYQYRCPAV